MVCVAGRFRWILRLRLAVGGSGLVAVASSGSIASEARKRQTHSNSSLQHTHGPILPVTGVSRLTAMLLNLGTFPGVQ